MKLVGSVYNPGPFLVKFPGRWRLDPEPLLPDFKLYSVRHFDPKAAGDRFRVSHGQEPNDIANLADEKWFDAVKAKLTNDETGEALRSSEPFATRLSRTGILLHAVGRGHESDRPRFPSWLRYDRDGRGRGTTSR